MGPLVFKPYLRPQVWGNRRLEQLFGKSLPQQGAYGESWELSAHPQHVSRVAEGPLKGTQLTQLCSEHAEALFGDQVPAGGHFPLLIKLLDCNDWLSVQVHPNDVLARQLLGEENGKTEAWVVLEARPEGQIFAGLLPGVTRTELERHLQTNTVAQCVSSFHPQTGDCVFLPAGTVHAVGGGVVLAEVQQSSDATFRLYDWNRHGADGKARPLHIAESLAAIDWSAGPVQPIRPKRIDETGTGDEGENLVRCPYFCLDRYYVGRSFDIPHPEHLSIWMVIDAAAELRSPSSSYQRVFHRGETVLLPASTGGATWLPVAGNATLLGIHLP